VTEVGSGLDPSRAQLFGRLAIIEAAVRASVGYRRIDDPQPDDPFRGLYVSDEHVDRLLEGPSGPSERKAQGPSGPSEREAQGAAAGVVGQPEAQEARLRVEADADAAEAAGHHLRLRHLARSFGLVPADIDILLVAMAPDLDSRFEKLYGYLNDDVTRRRATVGLALELADLAALDSAVRARVLPGSPMVDGGLLLVEEPDRPFLTRSLRVPDRVTAHLLGGDQPDTSLLHCLAELPPLPEQAGLSEASLGRALRHGATLVHLHEKPGAASRMAAVVALREAGLGAVVIDLHRLAPEEDIGALAQRASREARLRGAGLVVGPLEVLTTGDVSAAGGKAKASAAVRHLAEVVCPIILYSRGTWDPAWSRGVALNVEAPSLDRDEREAAWRGQLAADAAPDLDPAAATAHFRLAPEHIVRATSAARHQATLHGGPVSDLDLRSGARAQNAAGLEHLARRVEPRVGWVDLVLPPNVFSHLHELVARARNRPKVLEEWNLRPGGGRGRGIAALFAGDSGTGKTMSAEVVAFELGLDLYTVNLATVVDKYVGETEKNLERIFSEADGVNGVLLFDEADALFGKRSEVKDAHDRYANIEVAYLLQRMETFDGLAILSTNLRANVDEAFARRLDSVVDFPMPGAPYRRVLWDSSLGKDIPRADDVDLPFLADRFELSGGNIRSIALTAAYMAAETGQEVTMADLVRATAREYRKLGRLIVNQEFGPYHDLVRSEERD